MTPAEVPSPSAAQADLLRRLLDAGHLIETGVAGVYGHSEAYERVRGRFEAIISQAAAAEGASKLRFPPVVSRLSLEDNGYISNFPHLAASIFGFHGSEADALKQGRLAAAHDDWSEFQERTDLMMLPAACYPVYPSVAAAGPLEPGGAIVDLEGAWVFRHEPSLDPARRQIFRMHEVVRIGAPEEVAEWRPRWVRRAVELFAELGLDANLEAASDPFFGRPGRLLAANQTADELKFEMLLPIAGPEPTACASFNYHLDHFAGLYGLTFADGSPVHTACVAFGQDRIVLALLATHGLDPDRWPTSVRTLLWD